MEGPEGVNWELRKLDLGHWDCELIPQIIKKGKWTGIWVKQLSWEMGFISRPPFITLHIQGPQ